MIFKNGYLHWDRGKGEQITDHFHALEFECQCGRCVGQRISVEIISRLELIRRDVGHRPLRITEGFRCSSYQNYLRNAKKPDGTPKYKTSVGVSQHQLGNAVDFLSGGYVHLQHIRPVFRAIGDGNTFFHVDLRDDKERYWIY